MFIKTLYKAHMVSSVKMGLLTQSNAQDKDLGRMTEINTIVWGIHMWAGPPNTTGYQAVNYIHPQGLQRKTGIHLPWKRNIACLTFLASQALICEHVGLMPSTKNLALTTRNLIPISKLKKPK